MINNFVKANLEKINQVVNEYQLANKNFNFNVQDGIASGYYHMVRGLSKALDDSDFFEQLDTYLDSIMEEKPEVEKQIIDLINLFDTIDMHACLCEELGGYY